MKNLLNKLGLLITGAILGALMVVKVTPLRDVFIAPQQGTVAEGASKPQSARPLSVLEITEVKDLPKAVFGLVADSDGRMANPDENWNSIDVTFPNSAPHNRLLWATSVEYGNIYIVAFEVGGGFVPYKKIIVAEYDGKSATIIWHYETKH